MLSDVAEQLLTMFGAALPASVIALIARCDPGQRPFQTRKSTTWSLIIIGTIAALSAIAGVFAIGRIVPADSQFYYVSVTLPFVLCGRKIAGRPRSDPGQGIKPVPLAMSLGVLILLDRLDARMANDRRSWVEGVPYEDWSGHTLLEEGMNLYRGLSIFAAGNEGRIAAARRNWQDLEKYVNKTHMAVHRHGDHERAVFQAQEAYVGLRGQAYDWRFDLSSDPNKRARRWARARS